jgi:hypothetical protein
VSFEKVGWAIALMAITMTSWVVVFVRLSEVTVWAGFFAWRDTMPSITVAHYHWLLQYVRHCGRYRGRLSLRPYAAETGAAEMPCSTTLRRTVSTITEKTWT